MSMSKNSAKWIKLFSRGHHPVLVGDSIFYSLHDGFGKYYNLPAVKYFARDTQHTYVDELWYKKVKKIIIKRLNTKWPEKIVVQVKRDLSEFNSYGRKLRYLNKSNVNEFLRQVYKAWQSIYQPIIVGFVIYEQLKLLPNIGLKQRQLLQKIVNIPIKSSQQNKYFNTLHKYKKGLTSYDIKKIINDYKWIKTYLMSVKPLSRNDVLRDYSFAKKARQNNIFKLGKISKPAQRLLYLGRLYSWFRDWRLFQYAKFFVQVKPILTKYAKNFDLTYDQLLQLTVSEFVSGKFSLKNLQQRKKRHGSMFNNGKISVLCGSKLKEFERQVRQNINKNQVVYGSIACRGTVRGKVRIADPYTFHKIKQGEILVTTETTPNAVPYLRKVKAIVTDEGGVSSHAAIISRELNIPCVIGTKIATQVFKNGDRVEVDADKGIVKIIKKSRSR